MAVTQGPRFGLTRWSDDNDEWDRSQWDADNGLMEDLGAIDLQVATVANRPAAGKRGRYCWVESDLEIGNKPSLWRDSGIAWTRVYPARNVPERAVIQFGPEASNNPVNVPSVGWYPAGREMKFIYASGGSIAPDGDIGEELVGGDVGVGGANDFWRPYTPSWITDVIDDPANTRPGLITVGELGLYEVRVAIALMTDAADGYWCAGIGSSTMGGASETAPVWSGAPTNLVAATRSVVFGGAQAHHLEVSTVLFKDNPANALEILPFLYFGSTSTSSGQRQFSTCTVTITRWPGA